MDAYALHLHTLKQIRHQVYQCCERSADALFDLTDALSSEATARSLPELSLSPSSDTNVQVSMRHVVHEPFTLPVLPSNLSLAHMWRFDFPNALRFQASGCKITTGILRVVRLAYASHGGFWAISRGHSWAYSSGPATVASAACRRRPIWMRT